jgi:hypothetical protein
MSRNSIKAFIKYELFLFFLPLFFVFNQYNKFPEVITLNDTINMAIIYTVLLLLLRIAMHLLKWKRGKAAIFVLSFSIIFFFFGFLHDGIKNISPGSFLTRYVFILPFLLLTFVLIFTGIKRANRKFLKASLYFSVLFALIFSLELVSLFTGKEVPPPRITNNMHPCDSCTRPDLYLIVADEYAGQQELKEVFQFDNAGFINSLRQKGFKIAEESRSNYNSTSYSMASMLNMEYLTVSSNKENSSEIDKNINRIQNNLLTDFLKKQGYAFFNYSVFNIAGQLPPHASLFFLNGTKRIHYQTLVGRIEKDMFFNLITRLKWHWLIERIVKRNLANTEELITATKKIVNQNAGKPKFVYTHLMMPHFPYLLDSAGKQNSFNSITSENWTSKSEYLSYLKYSNKRFLELFEHIIKNAKRPLVVLFLSDHGFRFLNKMPANEPYHFMNMNAVYSSENNCNELYPGISPINQFRSLLNSCFGQQLPLLKDSSIFIY